MPVARQPLAAVDGWRDDEPPELKLRVGQTKRSPMTVVRVVPILRVTDIQSAIDFYSSKLGFVTEFRYSAGPDGPWYAGLSLDGNHIHLSTFAGDGVVGTAVYCYVDDVDALFDRLRQAGLKFPRRPGSPVEESPVDQAWSMRELYVRDPDGNTLRFGSPHSQAG